MKKWKSIVGGMVVVCLTMVSSTALATDTVRVGGQSYTCTNRCVVTGTPSNYSISDCCGGQVSTTFNPPTQQQ
jgi:hypothetical protein